MNAIEIIILILATIISFVWFYGMRDSISKGKGVTNANANITFLCFLSIILIVILSISPYHLLWIFPLIFIVGMTLMVVPIFPFSLFNYGGKIMIRLAFLGLNIDEIKTNERRLKLLSEIIYKENLDEEGTKKAVERLKREGKW